LGDSNVDNGNLLRISGQRIPAPPNWQGRNSNGPNVAERLAQALNAQLEDHAVSGATTGESNVLPDNYIPGVVLDLQHTGMSAQVTALEKSAARFSSSDLVLLWAGSNDIYAVKRTDRATLDQRIATATANIDAAIGRLNALGAQRFVVASRTPRPVLGSDDDLNGVDLNKAIAATVAQAGAKRGIDVRLYDAYGAIADMMKSPANYGFKEVNVLCWTVPACANDSLEGGLPVANTYVNWDGAHKTTRVHQLMAEQITQMVK
jgi:phospholipase/lecithinase/hemolysin